MDIWFLCLTCMILMCWMNIIDCVLWQLVSGYANRRSLDFFLEVGVGSKTHCSTYCYQTPECIAFILAPNETLNCQLLSKVAIAANNYAVSQDATFYTRDMDCSMTAYGSKYRTAISADGYAFAYRICTFDWKNRNQCVAYCQSNGGNLFRLTTSPKHIKLTSIIKSCTYLEKHWNYRVDGTNVAASDHNDLNGWTMTNGDVLPSSVWASGYPSDPSIRNCVTLWSAFSWFAIDGLCRTSMYFFCEK